MVFQMIWAIHMSSSAVDWQSTVAGAAQCGIEDMTCTHACPNVSTTLGEVGVTMDGSNNVCENVCRVKRRPDHAHETAASTDPRINPG